jgi:hypothetical protein
VNRYNRNVETLQGEMAPHQKTIEDYNTAVSALNASGLPVGDSGIPLQFVPAQYIEPAPSGPGEPVNYYETLSSRAQYSDGVLKEQDGSIKSINRRGEIVQRNAGREAERLENEIALNQRRALEEEALRRQPNSGSVIDQNMSGVFQSISDWLKG